MNSGILIIDYGSQYTQLIARRIREMSVYCEIHPFNKINDKLIKRINPRGIILSGGPNSVLDKKSPKFPKILNNYSYPILAICYGMQLISYVNGGIIKKSYLREYGYSSLNILDKSLIIPKSWYKKIPKVWMSHGDSISKIPKNFKIIGKSNNNIIAILENEEKKIYCLQFHPEVYHTENGKDIIKNFIFKACRANKNWIIDDLIKNKIKEIKNIVGKDKVVCGISGGIDSSVTAHIIKKAINKNLYCIFIDHGLLRKNEFLDVKTIFKKKYKKNFISVNASKIFLKNLKNIKNPEMKRKIIGKTFIDVFNTQAKKIKNVKFLAQGTLYPDIIESISFFGTPTSKIKSHHNVGGLPKKMKLKVIEPLKELFKDEVRFIAKEMKIDKKLINRHPFPGPGLAIRIPGKIDNYKIKLLQNVDEIYINYLKQKKLYDNIWQAFAVLLPIKSVGVMGDRRTYNYACSLRAVTSVDGMTADFYMFKKEDFIEISNKIINKVNGINRVLYDFTSKPPGTIEWE